MKVFLIFLIFNFIIVKKDRDRMQGQNASGLGAEREGDMESEAGSRL